MSILNNVLKQTSGFCKITCVILVLATFSSCKKKDKEITPDPVPVLDGSKAFKSFIFKASKNPVLVKDVIGEINGDTIYAHAFAGTDISKLIPEFTYNGANVTVGDTEQVSSVTVHDFNNLVTYNVTAEDNSKKAYVIKFTDNGISALYISTNGAPIDSKEIYVSGTLKLVGNFKDVLYEGKTQIKGHGNSTWQDLPKKPYKIKLDKKSGLLGMNESKNWILLANYADKTLMRNELAFILSRSIGRAFTTNSRYVEVFLNGEYRGNYQLTEQVKEGKNLVDIEEQPDGTTALPDLSGGYLVEQDGFADSEPVHFYTQKEMPVTVKYPDEDVIDQQQIDYIKDHFQKFEDALFSPGFADPVNGYRKYFDVDTYVDFYIVNEVMGNPDTFRSTYMYKERNDDRIYTGPVWDFDKTANNDNRLGDQVNGLMFNAAFEPKMWINRLMEDPGFRRRVRARWNELKAKIKTLPDSIGPLEKKLAVSQVRNFTHWDIIGRQSYLEVYVAGSYGGEVTYLKNFLTNHINWLDAKFNSADYQ